MDGIKLVCFDLNGTLISGNPWYELNLAMGMTPDEDNELLRLHKEHVISYEEGQKRIERFYLASGMATKRFIEEKLSIYTFMPHAQEIVVYLQKKGYELAIATGSMDLLAANVARDLGIKHWAANNRFVFDDEGKMTAMECFGDRAKFKVDTLTRLCDVINMPLAACACVGDSLSDKGVFYLTGHGIGFEGTDAARFAQKTIGSLADIREIL